MKTSIKSILKITGIPVLVASLCCLTPVIIVLFGLGSVSIAASLADTLYGTYKWVFRIVGLMLLILSVIWYLRREKGICTIDEVKRRRNEILNVVGVALTVGVVGYLIWLYVVVEYSGKWLNIWN
ncbi:MAG: hypothetical protein COV08_02360 [Candidatus Vogelbacteria bacterium CG10_big_fil_rev_8_21_14_0_10_49_38]|uniref:Mercury ion transport protein n=1 Tax=Candidatus Vogelbacteria bacterium CG10_big_fil_rev_8_21_14_0_10_49_38 TaxID=1975043 RepID=A0A2H0RHN1_9BACT|nr:MAG: hypothetical protein BK006_02380 [bacterium CG10_49_38]PIR45936.1 MAG: hypothetical protein COV08_02360 [Candidatus Vogelbacteria bacterium CG10_big_fil_rev_8_21_14_0_10_49_38]